MKRLTIKVELNGALILDPDLGRDLKGGHFGFAGHDDPVMFCNISIRSLR